MDSSLLKIALEVIDWAAYRQKKGALKLHMLLDGHDLLPDDAWITDGKAHDLEFAREQRFEKGTVILVDRGYNDSIPSKIKFLNCGKRHLLLYSFHFSDKINKKKVPCEKYYVRSDIATASLE